MEEDRLYDLDALDEDIKIIEELIEPFREQNRKGIKLILDIKGIKYEHYEAIEHLIEAYRKVKKQNKKMEELIENSECDMCTNFVRKSKIKEKIEEILEKGKQMSEIERQEETQFMQGKLKALEELLEEEK